MYLAKALVSIKQKGDGFKVKAVQNFSPLPIPSEWKSLQAWVNEGWNIDWSTRSLVNQSETDTVLIVLVQMVKEPGDDDAAADPTPV